ncbi:uncharacterized protein EI90DRAFT_3087170, partial [Cantharellus anzutake]|uniref:uncharacterized protein n=1 Tax=Cantharellus anzutake TaxID=1750568 RepID=UPI0019051E72
MLFFLSVLLSTPLLSQGARLPSSENLPSDKLVEQYEAYSNGSHIERRAPTNGFTVVGNSGVSAQMMFLGRPNKVSFQVTCNSFLFLFFFCSFAFLAVLPGGRTFIIYREVVATI